ncbi:MAG: acetyl-CoA carboxylase biotin carboxyl carrier protein [Betaproteobacteria bacterium]|nr:acetyl-CoA carboxylase biotin carboxyl carrier protein [Betaproteobacteria bacterium]
MKPRSGPASRRRPARAPRAAARAPTSRDLVQIVELVRSAAQFSEFRLRSGGIEVEMKRMNGAPAARAAAPERRSDPVGGEVSLEPASAALRVPHARAATDDLPAGLALVRAPMVGTFYCAPEPGAPPFVEPGTRVEADTTVCVIEVMKLMNSIPAGCAGVVRRVLVDNAEPVEYGQPLIAIEPQA